MTSTTSQNQPLLSPAIRLVMMPRDTNAVGTIFGGHILSLIDLAAGQHARAVSPKVYVTKVMREIEFIAPVFVGDSVSFYTSTVKVGRSSITIRVDVEATRGVDFIQTTKVTSAEVVMVAVDRNFKPVEILATGGKV
ncbi:MAG: acyl-CoA thioesterase [Proteobacteria bacterium]|nr:acyl-CoA thioesterase [Pseudomonadota bacterium]